MEIEYSYNAEGPYVVWEDYGTEGWKPKSYKTAKDALLDRHYGTFIITKVLDFEIKEL